MPVLMTNPPGLLRDCLQPITPVIKLSLSQFKYQNNCNSLWIAWPKQIAKAHFMVIAYCLFVATFKHRGIELTEVAHHPLTKMNLMPHRGF